MKLKNKILFPIVGVTALSASVTPALVGCNNKAEVEIKQFGVHVEQTSAWTVDFIEGQGPRTIEADKNKDLRVDFAWKPTQEETEIYGIEKLYASSLTIVVNGSPIGPASKDNPGYEIKLRQENKLEIEIQKECFDWEQFPDAYITFHLGFAIDYVDVNVNVDTFAETYYTDENEVKYDCLHSKPTSIKGSEEGTTVEFAADLTKWKQPGPKLNSIYLAVLESDGAGGKQRVQLQDTGTAYLGMKSLATHVVGGFVMIDAPEGGWNVNQPLNIYIDFLRDHDGLELILAEPNANVTNVTSKIRNTNYWITDPEFVNYVPYYDGTTYQTTIKWNPQGLTQTLYASGKVVKVNGTEVPAVDVNKGITVGYTIVEELSNNQFTISIPKDFMVEVGGKLELELDLYMSESQIDDDITMETFTNSYNIPQLGECSLLYADSVNIAANETVEFHAPLMNWGGTVPGNTETPTNNFFLLGLFDASNELIPITETGTVYYGSTELATDINNGYMMIYAPEAGWGEAANLQDIHVWMDFEESHEGIKVAILQPNAVHTPVKMNFIDTGSWLVAEPIVKYSALMFGESDEYFTTEVQLVPQGINNVIIPSYSVTYVNASGGSKTLEEGKDYTVSGFKNNSKTFVFPKGLFTGVAIPELTIRGNVQNPSVESFAGVMDNFSESYAGHTNCIYSKEFAVTGTIPVIDSTYVECQIQLFNWAAPGTKLDDVAQFEVELWDVTNNEQIPITQVGGSGLFDDNSIYYRQNNNTLDYSFSKGNIIIDRKGTNWGGMPGTIHFSIQFTQNHSKLELRAFPRVA